MSAVLATLWGLSDEETEAVSWAGMLHDVGKLGVTVHILRKTGPLDESEWAEIHRHPVIGSDLILAISPTLMPIAKAIRAHHERWNGCGYPDHLSREDIPLLGRIISITDAFDSITHHRSYRKRAFSPAEALEMIGCEAGVQFAPDLVRTFTGAYEAGRIPTEGIGSAAMESSEPEATLAGFRREALWTASKAKVGTCNSDIDGIRIRCSVSNKEIAMTSGDEGIRIVTPEDAGTERADARK
jgi:HD-GYP domain-containing protein (c-di-GMP phosphodiesterase class II)